PAVAGADTARVVASKAPAIRDVLVRMSGSSFPAAVAGLHPLGCESGEEGLTGAVPIGPATSGMGRASVGAAVHQATATAGRRQRDQPAHGGGAGAGPLRRLLRLQLQLRGFE